MKQIANITREKYISSPKPHVAAMLTWGNGAKYTGVGLHRQENLSDLASSDWCKNLRVRYSDDNGHTWSDWQPTLEEHPTQGVCTNEELEFARGYDPESGKMLKMIYQRILKGNPVEALENDWKGIKSTWDHAFWQVSDDDGLTWGMKHQIIYQPGSVFDPDNWANPDYLATNQMYGGYNIQPLSGGGIAYSGSVTSDWLNEQGNMEQVYGVICLIGRWNSENEIYEWTASELIAVSNSISSRGLMEPCIVQLSDGNLLLEMRGSNSDSTPGRKWISVSKDTGKTWSKVTDLKYDDGTSFYAPSTFARILRSTKTRKLYWVGNISPVPPDGNSPRHPLYIAEIDEEIPALKRDTLTKIDDYDPENDTALLQLSNFSIFENRETQDVEIYLTRLGERGDGEKFEGDFWTADVYKYTIKLA